MVQAGLALNDEGMTKPEMIKRNTGRPSSFEHLGFLRHSSFVICERYAFALRLCTTSLFPSGSRNCAIQQTGVSVLGISKVTPRDFSFSIVASMSSTSKATVVPSRDGCLAGCQPTPIEVGPKSYSTHAPSTCVRADFNTSVS